MKLVMRSMIGEIHWRFDEGDLTIGNGAQSSRWMYISRVDRFNEYELDEDLTIVFKWKKLEDSRGMEKVFYLKDEHNVYCC